MVNTGLDLNPFEHCKPVSPILALCNKNCRTQSNGKEKSAVAVVSQISAGTTLSTLLDYVDEVLPLSRNEMNIVRIGYNKEAKLHACGDSKLNNLNRKFEKMASAKKFTEHHSIVLQIQLPNQIVQDMLG